jgi:hypothetical protein
LLSFIVMAQRVKKVAMELRIRLRLSAAKTLAR